MEVYLCRWFGCFECPGTGTGRCVLTSCPFFYSGLFSLGCLFVFWCAFGYDYSCEMIGIVLGFPPGGLALL